MKKPLLSIGIIFKNEIRCLERCLKSLQPLREAVACQLVMADTGSDDGSREIAEKYADILVDFPWINDFSAARNAVMDRCSGVWYLTIDSDEWLDEDFSQLTQFLCSAEQKKFSFCGVIQRNYSTKDLSGPYSDFLAVRMARLSTGVRYAGAIHECWTTGTSSAFALNKTVLRHDGYVGLSAEEGRAKRERNLSLLRQELEKHPDDLKVMLQCIESSGGEPEHEHYLHIAAEGVKRKLTNWEKFGPAIFRSGAGWAADFAQEELDRWAEDARTWFPDSLCTKIDVAYIVCITYLRKQEYEKAIPFGEIYLQTMAAYQAGRCDLSDLLYSSLGSISSPTEDRVRLLMADAYFRVREYQKSRDMLVTLDGGRLRADAIKDYVGIVCNLHSQSGLDLSQVMLALWEQLGLSKEKNEKTAKCLGALSLAAAQVFPQSFRDAETRQGFKHAYTAFLPLAGKFEMGTAARVLSSTGTEEMEDALAAVKDWNDFPIHALSYALRQGIHFPLKKRPPMGIEEMDALASRLAADEEDFFRLVDRIAGKELPATVQDLAWARAMVLLAVQKYGWGKEDQAIEQGMLLARKFAEVERKFLPLCYTPAAMTGETLLLLPPLHRFGVYCTQAFTALDAGDVTNYVRLLREGLLLCESANDMVRFLQAHTPELQAPAPSAELLSLAEQIRNVLANFSPDDPAVAALKQSEVYQKVAYLIEGMEAPVAGGLLQ